MARPFASKLGNPWTAAEWSVTKQGEFVRLYGLARAEQFAAQAGTVVGGARPTPDGPTRVIERFILNKRPSGAGGAPAPQDFLGLTDTPDDYLGDALKLVRVKATEDGLEFVADTPAPQDFLGLTDTPDSYNLHALDVVRVNQSEDGLEFVTMVLSFLGLSDTPDSYAGQAGRSIRVKDDETGLEYVIAREAIGADLTLYVRTDGNDANDGMTNTAGGAFLTIARAFEVAATYDLSAFAVTVQLGVAGTYAGATMDRPFVGGPGSVVRLVGDVAAASSYVISSQIAATRNAVVALRGVDLTSSNFGVNAQDGGIILVDGATVFGACTAAQVQADRTGLVVFSADYTIDGGAPQHMVALQNGFIFSAGRTVTLTGTPAFSSQFAQASFGGVIQANGNTYSGAATGQRFLAASSGVLRTLGASVDYFPGSTPGAVSGGLHDMTLNGASIGFRNTIDTNITVNVATTGSDTTGSGTSAKPFATIQKAMDFLTSLDGSIFGGTIELANGTYAPFSTKKQVGYVWIRVNGTNGMGNVTISGSGATAVIMNSMGQWWLSGVKLTTSTSGHGIVAGGEGNSVWFQDIDFGALAAGHNHLQVAAGGVVTATGNYTISGAAATHAFCGQGSFLNLAGRTVSGGNATLNFSGGFVKADYGGVLLATGMTFSQCGNFTGQRFVANGLLQTGTTSLTYFPGNAAGSIASGGQYESLTGLSASPSFGIGYQAGAGGTVTQATNKATAVTLNTVCGEIVMNNANLNGNTSITFTLNNSSIAATDVVVVHRKSGGTANSYMATCDSVAAGSCTIQLRNITGAALAEAVTLAFAVIKGVIA